MKLDNLKDSQYNDEQVMRILDEFWNDTSEDWYEKEKQEHDKAMNQPNQSNQRFK